METITIVAFVGGIILGALGCFLVMTRTRAQGNMEQQLRELQEEFTAYRENVNTHFNKTAEMMNTLTENYLTVQKHLEDAADTFAEPPKSFQLQSALENKKTPFVSLEAKQKPTEEETPDAQFDETDMKQPRDYAPKGDTKEKGTLSEEFGLHDSKP